jgi:hypothetical protein
VTSLVASLLGLAVAWKWELTGGVVTLGAMLIVAFINLRGVLLTPWVVVPLGALLFLVCWWMRRAGVQAKQVS